MFEHGFPSHWTFLDKLIWLVGSGIAGAASGIWKTVTGTLIHITDALPSPVKELSVAIEPVQSGSGDPSPTNVRPITGWTGCNVTHSAHQYAFVKDSASTENAVTFTPNAENNSVRIYGTASGALTTSLTKPFSVDEETEITILGLPTLTNASYKKYYLWDATASQKIGADFLTNGVKRTIPANHLITLGFYLRSGQSMDDVAYPKFVDTYTTYPISWQTEAGTVYGGTVDLVTGVLTVDRTEISVSEKQWSYYRGGFYTSVQGGTNVSPISDKYKTAERVDGMGNVANWEDYTIRASTDGAYIYIKDTRYESANEFTTAEGDTAICYELATPTEISLTPQPISTLAGENNVWSNGDSVEITYKAQSA